MKKRDTILTIIFLLVIFIFPIGTLIRNGVDKSAEDDSKEREVLEGNGTLADNKAETAGVAKKKKEKKKYDYIEFRNDLSRFSQDMIGQKQMIDANARISYELSGGTYIESNSVILGDEDFLFYQVTTDGDPIQDYKGTNLFTNEELMSIGTNLVNIKSTLNARGIDFYVIAIPNKEQVYDRYMPATIYRDSEYSRGMQLRDFMRNNTNVDFIYPLDELKAASYDYQVFYKGDTHETERGAFIVFGEFYKLRYGETQPIEEAEFLVTKENYTGDLGLISNVSELEKNDSIVRFNQTNWSYHKPERVLFVGDSFAGYLTNIAGLNFDWAYRVNTADFSMALLDQYNPDIVVFESAERRIEILGENILVK